MNDSTSVCRHSFTPTPFFRTAVRFRWISRSAWETLVRPTPAARKRLGTYIPKVLMFLGKRCWDFRVGGPVGASIKSIDYVIYLSFFFPFFFSWLLPAPTPAGEQEAELSSKNSCFTVPLLSYCTSMEPPNQEWTSHIYMRCLSWIRFIPCDLDLGFTSSLGFISSTGVQIFQKADGRRKSTVFIFKVQNASKDLKLSPVLALKLQ